MSRIKRAEATPVDISQGLPVLPDDWRWGEPTWPAKVKSFRPHQLVAWLEIRQHYDNGIDVVIVNAPTGAGKTVIAEGVRRLLGEKSSLYVANTKGLQDQAAADFHYGRVLKGRSNYPTHDHPELFSDKWSSLSCADCVKRRVILPACPACPPGDDDASADPQWHCPNCHGPCPYQEAKQAALDAPLAIMNTAYFVAECNGPGQFAEDPYFVIVDEADTLESILMGQVEMVISKKDQEKYGIDPPERKHPQAAGSTARKQTWEEWANLTEEVLETWLGKVSVDAKDGSNVPAVKEQRHLQRLVTQAGMLKMLIAERNVVLDEQREAIVWKPVRVDRLAPSMLWQHGKRWLLMSATIIDPVEFVTSTGIEEAGLSWAVVNVPSTFPPENRPVRIRPTANNTFKEREEAWPKIADACAKVLDRHPTDRVLIHTVSYAFMNYLADKLRHTGRSIFTYDSARDRERRLREFKASPGGVLLAPSMARGVDLPEDDCRVVVITKMPYPAMQDPQVAARMHSPGGDLWYRVQTIREFVQMCGRGVRSATDQCDTYVLDSQFMEVWKKSRHLFPSWWVEAVDWRGRL